MSHTPSILASAALSAAALSSAARADDFTFDFSSPTTTAFGNLSASPNGNGAFSVFAGDLYVTAGGASGHYSLLGNANGLSPAYSQSGYFIYDNQLMPGQGAVMNVYGLLFGGSGAEINIWGNGAGNPYTFYSHKGGTNIVADGAFTLHAVPTPGVIATASLGGLLLIGRRTRRA